MNAVPYIPFARLLLLLVLLCPVSIFATTVYRTVDESGAVQFSDTPPVDLIAVDTLEINTTEPLQADETQQRLQAMRETTDRIVADRMARERHRAEMRRLGSETDLNRAALDSPPPAQEEYYYPVPYSYRTYPPLSSHRPNLPAMGNPVVQPTAVSHNPFSRIRQGYSPQVRDFFNR